MLTSGLPASCVGSTRTARQRPISRPLPASRGYQPFLKQRRPYAALTSNGGANSGGASPSGDGASDASPGAGDANPNGDVASPSDACAIAGAGPSALPRVLHDRLLQRWL